MRRVKVDNLDVEITGNEDFPGVHQWIIYNDFGWVAFRSDQSFETEDAALEDLRAELDKTAKRRVLREELGLQ